MRDLACMDREANEKRDMEQYMWREPGGQVKEQLGINGVVCCLFGNDNFGNGTRGRQSKGGQV